LPQIKGEHIRMNYYLSFSDLRLLDEWVEPQPDEKTLAKMLFTNGLDITRKYEVVFCKHRNLQSYVVDDYRVEGNERTDSAWRHSGAASLSAFLDSTKDLFLKEDLRKMSRQSGEKYFEKVKRALEGD